MPGGRPTKYLPEYCETAIAVLSQGYSISAVAAELRVNRDTIYEWKAQHPEFSDALKAGEVASAQWWQDRLRAIAMGGEGNAAAAIFGLKNRDRKDWRDKAEIDHTSSDGTMTPKSATQELLEAVRALTPRDDA